MTLPDTTRTADIISRLVERLRIMVREELQHSKFLRRRKGEVVAVNAGPPASVDVQLGGSDVTIPFVRYLDSYTPTVGDVIWVDMHGSDPLVVGKQANALGGSAGGNEISVVDARPNNLTPQQYDSDGLNQAVRWEFLDGADIGLTGYYGVQTIAPWGDDSGGGMWQVAYGADGVFRRYGTRAGGWGSWVAA